MSLATRTKLYLEREDALEALCKHVSCGGTIPNFCQLHDIDYAEVVWWLKQEQNRMKQVNGSRQDRNEWIIEGICSKLADLASVEASEYLDDNGDVKPVGDWTPRARYALSQYSVSDTSSGRRVSVKMQDKVQPITLIGKYLGMFTEQMNISADADAIDMIANVAERVQKKKRELAEKEKTNESDSSAKHLALVEPGT